MENGQERSEEAAQAASETEPEYTSFVENVLHRQNSNEARGLFPKLGFRSQCNRCSEAFTCMAGCSPYIGSIAYLHCMLEVFEAAFLGVCCPNLPPP